MENGQFEVQKKYRTSIETEVGGKVRWATDKDRSMLDSYKKLVDIFGKKLSSDEKTNLIEAMQINSGYSDEIISKENKKEPTAGITYDEEILYGNEKHYVAVCIYPSTNVLFPHYCHEGVHFLARYGDKNKRIIKKDVPLASIVDIFFTLREDPSKLEELCGVKSGLDIMTLAASQQNPFTCRFREHSVKENIAARITAAMAYLISKYEGEGDGAGYILNLMRNAELIKTLEKLRIE